MAWMSTRKSSEEGLEREFNSRHAQREACESYIVTRRAKLTFDQRAKLTPLAASRSGPEPTEPITEWRRVI
jgi:hypothetical protein